MYDDLLQNLLSLTTSEYGFVGEVLKTPEGESYLKLYSLTNIAWDEEALRLYESVRQKGFEIHNLNSLIGRVITGQEPVLSDDPLHDPRRGGFPPGHPVINDFLGIPVHYGAQLVGVIGLANREEGYDQSLLDYLAPMILACGQVIVARQNQVARRLAEEALEEMASVDALLGIPNRRSFEDFLAQEWRRGKRHSFPLSVIMLDIDHFKLYNDHYGHQAGDECLVRVATVIRDSLRRPTDMVGRYGGEEFICILPETPRHGAILLAKKIREKLAAEAIPHAASLTSDQVTLSMGIASTVPTGEGTVEALVEVADQYLYQAKSSGRDRFVSENCS